MIAAEILKAEQYGAFLDEENAVSILEHEVQDLFYYVRRRKLDHQGSAVEEWVQCQAVILRALKQFYPEKESLL